MCLDVNLNLSHLNELIKMQNNQWHWPLLHYALSQGNTELAKEAFQIYPDQAHKAVTVYYVPSLIPAEFQDLFFNGASVSSWHLAAMAKDEEFALQLLNQTGCQESLISHKMLEKIVLRNNQAKILDYMYRNGYPVSKNILSQINDLEMLKIVLFHNLKDKGSIESPNDLSLNAIEAFARYLGENPLMAALKADDWNSFQIMAPYYSGIVTVPVFEEALRKGDDRYVLLLCSKVESANYNFFPAIRANHLEAVRVLAPHYVNNRYSSPVSTAFQLGHTEMTYLLLELGIGRDDPWVFNEALLKWDYQLIDYLLDNNYCLDEVHCYPIRTAMFMNQTAIVKRLVAHGHSIMWPFGPSAYRDVIRCQAFDVFKYLLEEGYELGMNDMWELVEGGYVEQMKAVIERYPQDPAYFLGWAKKAQHPEMLQLLLEEGHKKH